MHLHLFFYIFLFVSPWAYANERQCLIGNSKSLNLINQIQKEKKTSLFLKQFINEREPQLCLTDTGLSAISQLRKLASDTSAKARPPGIKLECIKASMTRIPKIPFSSRSANPPYTRRGVCESDSAIPTWQTAEPCINEEVVELVQWSVNKALECGNALSLKISGLPIDPKIFFQKINNESAFGFHLQNKGGIGIGQLTTIAMQEVSNPSRSPIDGPPKQNYIEAAQEESACAPFKEIISKKLEYTAKNDVRHCQLIKGSSGLGRNLFYSIMLFIHNRSVVGYRGGRSAGGVQQIAKNYGITDPAKIDYLTLISYGRNGLAKAARTIEILSKNDSLSGVNLNDLPLDKFLGYIEKLSPYIEQTRNKMDEFLSYYHADKTPDNQGGKLCVE